MKEMGIISVVLCGGKEWNNVKINRKCIIPKCLRNIYNCGTSPVILRYYTVYTSTFTPVSVFM